MEIGKEKEKQIIEPIKTPVPDRKTAPEPEPSKPDPQREPVEGQCVCGHEVHQHPPHPAFVFAWPCSRCDCEEFRPITIGEEV